MTFKTIATTLATATALTGFAAAPAQAGPITTLGECYQAVLSWCEKAYPNHDCSQSSGLDQCDEVFGDTANAGKSFKMSLPGRQSAVFIKIPDIPGENRARSNRDDRRAGSSGGGSRPPSVGGDMIRPPRETATAVTTLRPTEPRIPIPRPLPSPIPMPRP